MRTLSTGEICLIMMALSVGNVFATDYCKLCPSGLHHIACKHNGKFANTCPKDATIVPMTHDLMNAILNEHNKLRNKIAEGKFNNYQPAERMATMEWDKELAQLAELNVKQCVSAHDQCRNTPNFQYAGQNIANTGYSGQELGIEEIAVTHVNLWFNENADCDMSYINKFHNNPNGKMIGHFTQVVNDKATHVGCAIVRMTKNDFKHQLMTCNYARINIADYPVYTAGAVASGCTKGKNSKFPFLCAPGEPINPNSV